MKVGRHVVIVLMAIRVAFAQQPPPGGVYELLSDGSRITIAPFGAGVAAFFSDGRVRGVRKNDSSSWVIGKSVGNVSEPAGLITLSGDGIRVSLEGAGTLEGTRLKLSRKPARFKNGRQQLAGELILPEGNGPFPAVVLAHGSGEETRDASLGMAYLFAANGIAALIYDKRGCGESSGKEWRAPFKDYAKDLLAGVRYLTTLPTIDSLRIGLYGHSQGAWVVPLAYSFHSERIAFCILSAGNAVSPVEQMLMAGDQELTLLGKDAVTIRDVHEFRRLKYSVGITGRGRKEYLSTSLPEAERESWFKLTGGALPDDKFWEANGFYDPAPALKALACPVLVLFAELDTSTDTQSQLPLMKQLLSGDVEYRVIPNANHMMLKVPGKGFTSKQLPTIDRFADGYLETLVGWTKGKAGLPGGQNFDVSVLFCEKDRLEPVRTPFQSKTAS
jgi:alpha-beta hydrolase superfamily lysophospholipase